MPITIAPKDKPMREYEGRPGINAVLEGRDAEIARLRAVMDSAIRILSDHRLPHQSRIADALATLTWRSGRAVRLMSAGNERPITEGKNGAD